MYHFTFIDETSTEYLSTPSEKQEREMTTSVKKSSTSQSILKKTAYFLHQYLDQPNCVRIFISKN